jgi:mono/diheme cytochrome c family protein
VQCHGERADGQGPLASKYTPRPSNLAASVRTDDYKAQIITLGGKAMGRSPTMPEWGLELTGQEILALVTYLRKVSDDAAAARHAPVR